MARPRRTWGQRILIVFNCLLVLACLTAAAGIYYADRSVSEIPRLALGGALAADKPASEPQNILLVGIDDGSDLPQGDPVLKGRGASLNTDTIMILRFDPASDKAYLLSLPRDLWVKIANTGKNQKINSAQASGGPENLIATIKNNFGIEIDHYAQVNLAGFKDLVSAVDGVPLYFPWPARDRHSDLGVDDPGCITLTPEQALAFTRSRYMEKFENGKWQSDPQSDLSRIQRQQVFIRAALKRAISKGVRNPFTLNELVGVAENSVTLDNTFNGGQIVDLGMEFRDFNPDSLEMYSPPVIGAMKGDASVLVLKDAEAQPVFDLFRGVSADGDTKASTSVEVRNGSGVSGQGSTTLNAFKDLGFFAVRAVDSSDFAGDTTVVLYQPGQEAKALEVARYIDGPFRFQEDTGLTDVNVAVVTGKGFAGVLTNPVDAASIQSKIPTTTTTTAAPGSPTTVEAAPTTPTTEANLWVPSTPEGQTCG